MKLEVLTQIGAVCKAYFLLDQITHHFNNDWVLSFKTQFICNFTSGQTSSNHGWMVANCLFAPEEFTGFDHFFVPRYFPQNPWF